jgi:hypothetical protein
MKNNSITQDKAFIAKLKSEHGNDLRIVETDDTEIVLRPPTRVEWAAFRSMASEKDKKQYAQEDLSRACVVYPDREAFDKLLDKRPGLGDALSDICGELAIGAERIVAKKL